MAGVSYALNDTQDVKVWVRELIRESIPQTFWFRWLSTAPTSPLYKREELSKGPGSTMQFHLRVKGTGAGTQGDNTLEGKEEGMTDYSDTLIVNQLRHAFKSEGRMSEQRPPWKVREELKDLAVDWWSERDDVACFNHACGFTAQTDTRYTGNNSVTAPTTKFMAGTSNTNDEDLASGDDFKVDLIDKAVNKAKIMSPQLRPIKWRGGDYYICVLHPNQVRQLRDASSTWFDAMKAALQGGEITSNPLFTGAIGAWNGVVFFENNRVTNGVNSSTAAEITAVKRAPLLGAQALGIGFGQGYDTGTYDWVEKKFDYDNQFGVAIGRIFGINKLVFNSVDYGVITIHSHSDDPS